MYRSNNWPATTMPVSARKRWRHWSRSARVTTNRPYGRDRWTAEACDRFRELFERPARCFSSSTASAASSLALASLCQSYHSIVCHRLAHVETDECGAPEFSRMAPSCCWPRVTTASSIRQRGTTGHQAQRHPLPQTEGDQPDSVHRSWARSHTAELHAIRQVARRHGLKLHLDGARFANAVAALGLTPRALTVDCGADVLCFGGARTGLALGEAVLFFDLAAAEEFAYRCKQAGQLASKMRFWRPSGWGAENRRWLRRMPLTPTIAPAVLEAALQERPEVELMFPSSQRGVRAATGSGHRGAASAGLAVHVHWRGWARLMCAWDTAEETLHAVADLKTELRMAR